MPQHVPPESPDPTPPRTSGQKIEDVLAAFCAEAGKPALINHALIEATDPPPFKILPFAQWPATLAALISGGKTFLDDGKLDPAELVLKLPPCLSLFFGEGEALKRFVELASAAAEALQGKCPRQILPPWLKPFRRWMHLLYCLHWNSEGSAHGVQARGAIWWRDGADGRLVTDFNPEQLALLPHWGSNPMSRILRSQARARGLPNGAGAVEVYYFEMRDLWGASLEALRRLALHMQTEAGSAEPAAAQAPADGESITDNDSPKKDKSTKGNKLARAILTLKDHPSWTNLQIANHVGCHPKYLSNSKLFQQSRRAIKEEGRDRHARGTKSKDGRVEAWHSDEKQDD